MGKDNPNRWMDHNPSRESESGPGWEWGWESDEATQMELDAPVGRAWWSQEGLQQHRPVRSSALWDAHSPPRHFGVDDRNPNAPLDCKAEMGLGLESQSCAGSSLMASQQAMDLGAVPKGRVSSSEGGPQQRGLVAHRFRPPSLE